MYLPRNLIAHLYQNLIKRTHAAAPPVLLLVALEPDALVRARGLSKRFGDFVAVDGVDFEVRRGEVFGSSDRTGPARPRPCG